MKKRFSAALILCALAAMAPAFAAPSLTHVAELVSEQGEPLEDFVLRIAPVLDRYTHETGFEACGMVAQSADGERFGVRLGSTKGAMTCEMRRSNVPEGMTALRLSIHSHPHKPVVMPTAADVSFYAGTQASNGRMILRGRPERVGGAYFSAADYASGPGYLVSEGRVLYQQGKGTERDLGAYADGETLMAKAD
ncbi:hypothetical protein ACWKWK_10370 [Pseudoxanthomonas beigongshangi]